MNALVVGLAPKKGASKKKKKNTVKGRLESREEHGMPKSYWVKPGAPPAQWLKARRRVLTEEMQGNLLPSNVVEAMGPLSSLIRLVSSNDHREQIRNELYPLLREALQGGDPLRADAPKACRTSLVCGVKQCGGSKTGATHHILCKTYSARSGTVKEVNAAIKEYLPDLTARSAQARGGNGDFRMPSTRQAADIT
jgi:hypothetical protein